MARRKLIWARLAPAITSLNNTSAGIGGSLESQDLLSDFRTEAGLLRGPVGCTVMRVRLSINAVIQSTAPNVLPSINANGMYYGIRVFDQSELTVQETIEAPAVGPQLDRHADWMAWGRVPMKAFAGTPGVATSTGIYWVDVDVRSMRKMEELGQTLGLIVQTTSAVVGGTIDQVVAATSVLLALP